MFFVLSKTISFLLQPVTLVLITFIAAAVIKKPKWKKLLFRAGLIMLVLFSNQFLANSVMGWWEDEPKKITDVDKHRYAVVLGGMLDLEQEPRDRVYFNQSVDRILHAVHLYKSGKVEKVLVTGGSGSIYDQSIKEGDLIKDFVIQTGVQPGDLIIERESRNTYENAQLTKKLVPPEESGKLLLVTSAFHMRRASACYRRAGYSITTFPTSFQHDEFKPHMLYTPSGDAMNKWETIFREMFGYLAYALMGYL